MFKKGLIGFSLIIIILIITMSFVSAEENTTQTQIIEDNQENTAILESPDENSTDHSETGSYGDEIDTLKEEYAPEPISKKSKPDIEFFVQKEMLLNSGLYIGYHNQHDFFENAYIDIYIDNEDDSHYYSHYDLSDNEGLIAVEFQSSDDYLSLGKHTLKLSYDNIFYEPYSKTFEFEVVTNITKSQGTHKSDIEFYVPEQILKDTSFYYEYNNSHNFVGDIQVYIDDNFYEDHLYDDYIYVGEGLRYAFSAENLPLGKHTCKLVHGGNTYYEPFNKTFEFEVVTSITKSKGTNKLDIEFHVPEEILQNTTLYLEYDNQPNFEGYVYVYIDNKPEGGISLYSGSDFTWENLYSTQHLPLGKHTINLVYVGNHYYEPFNKTFEFEIVSSNPKSSGTHKTDMQLYVSDEILSNSSVFVNFNNAYDFIGDIAIYIDNKYYDILDIHNSESGWTRVDSSDTLALGNHTCTLVYGGNHYYEAFNKTLEFEVTDIIFDLNEKMYDTNSIRVLLQDDATGTVTITINGSKKEYTVNGDNIEYPVSQLKYGKYKVEISYIGNYGNRTIVRNVTIDYPMSFYKYNDDEIHINFDYYNYGNMTVLIDGKDINYDKYDVEIPEDEPSFLFLPAPIDLTKHYLSKGNHTVELIYSGDDIRPAKSIKETFYIKNSKLNLDKNMNLFVNSKIPINFQFSENTTGNFSIYSSTDGENYTLIENMKIINNTANVNVTFTKTGTNHLKVIYNTNNGNDEFEQSYEVSDVKVTNWNINVSGIYGGDSKDTFMNSKSIDTISLEYGETVAGNVSIYIKSKNSKKLFTTEELIEGGKMNITLPQKEYTKQAGTYSIEVVWNTDYGSGNDEFTGINVIDGTMIFPENLELEYTNITIYHGEKATFSVEVYGEDYEPLGKNQIVTFTIGKQTFKEKTNENGIATLNIPTNLKPGKYTIKASYNHKTYKQALTVKHILTIKTVKVKKSAKKLVLTAKLAKKLKGKKITFKFNGKKYTAKTNKNGIAKVTIKKSALKKLKVGKKVTYQATYLKDTVKKTAKILK